MLTPFRKRRRFWIALCLLCSLVIWLDTANTEQPSQSDETTPCHRGLERFRASDFHVALPLLEEGFRVRTDTSVDQSHDFGICALMLGVLRHRRDEYSGALEAYEVALNQFRESSMRQLEASVRNNIGVVYQKQARYQDALARFEQALLIWREIGDRPDQEGFLQDASLVYAVQGRYGEGIEHYEQIPVILREISERSGEGTTLDNIGAVYQAQGHYQEAQTRFQQALEIRQEVGDHLGEAITLRNLGEVYREQARYEESWDYHNRALKTFEHFLGPDHPHVATSFARLAGLLHVQGEYDTARSLYERALKIQEQVFGPDHPEVALSLSNLSELLQDLGKNSVALPFQQRALAILKASLGSNHPYVGNSFINIAKLLQAQGDYVAARPLYERALQIFEDTLGPMHLQIATPLKHLALLDWQQQNSPQVRSHIFRAGRIIDAHIQRLFPTLSFAEQYAFLATHIPLQVSVLLTTHREGKLLQDAYSMLFRWKGLLAEFIRHPTTRLTQKPVYASQIKHLKALRARLAGWYFLRRTVPLDKWYARRKALTREKEALERTLARALPSGLWEDPLREVDFHKFQTLLKHDEVFLDVYYYNQWQQDRNDLPFVTPHKLSNRLQSLAEQEAQARYAVIVIGPAEPPVMVDLGPAKAVEQAVRAWRLSVLRRHKSGSAWRDVVGLVWNRLANKLPANARKIWLSPDGNLYRLPWNLLPPMHDDTRDMLLTQINFAREFVLLRRTASPPPPTRKQSLLLVGGVDFDAGENIQEDRRDIRRFMPLTATSSEVDRVQVLGKKRQLSVISLKGADARKETIIKSLPEVTYVHLATYGFFLSEPPSLETVLKSYPIALPQLNEERNPLVRSGIVLAGANVLDPSAMHQMGFLTAEELIGLDLSRNILFTLSANDTGLGEEIPGQGVMGLRSVVMAAGARSMLVSLWRIPDEATKVFMEHFYSWLWLENLPAAKALQKAQEAMRHNPKFAHPINWASWVLVGEGW